MSTARWMLLAVVIAGLILGLYGGGWFASERVASRSATHEEVSEEVKGIEVSTERLQRVERTPSLLPTGSWTLLVQADGEVDDWGEVSFRTAEHPAELATANDRHPGHGGRATIQRSWVFVTAPRYGPEVVAPDAFCWEEDRRTVTVRLRPRLEPLEVLVEDPDGRPISGARLTWFRRWGREALARVPQGVVRDWFVHTVETNASGVATLPAKEPRALSIEKEGFLGRTVLLPAVPGGRETIRLPRILVGGLETGLSDSSASISTVIEQPMGISMDYALPGTPGMREDLERRLGVRGVHWFFAVQEGPTRNPIWRIDYEWPRSAAEVHAVAIPLVPLDAFSISELVRPDGPPVTEHRLRVRDTDPEPHWFVNEIGAPGLYVAANLPASARKMGGGARSFEFTLPAGRYRIEPPLGPVGRRFEPVEVDLEAGDAWVDLGTIESEPSRMVTLELRDTSGLELDFGRLRLASEGRWAFLDYEEHGQSVCLSCGVYTVTFHVPGYRSLQLEQVAIGDRTEEKIEAVLTAGVSALLVQPTREDTEEPVEE